MSKDHDPINHPSHYTDYKGLEVIDLTEQMNFNRGNAVKYICRAGKKAGADETEDLKKAIWYIEREIQRIESLCLNTPIDHEITTTGKIFIPKEMTWEDKTYPEAYKAKQNADIEAVKRAADRQKGK